MSRIIDVVIVIILFLYLCIGIFGYISHIDKVPYLIVFRPPLSSIKGSD